MLGYQLLLTSFIALVICYGCGHKVKTIEDLEFPPELATATQSQSKHNFAEKADDTTALSSPIEVEHIDEEGETYRLRVPLPFETSWSIADSLLKKSGLKYQADKKDQVLYAVYPQKISSDEEEPGILARFFFNRKRSEELRYKITVRSRTDNTVEVAVLNDANKLADSDEGIAILKDLEIAYQVQLDKSQN